ncbi:unnamed protein product [Rotaria sp. Silwood2]|nr:unnamed protein product [Rotaria sp. Silwood2]
MKQKKIISLIIWKFNYALYLDKKCELSFKHIIPTSSDYDSSPHSVAIGDFNNDNWSDIVVANYNTNNVGIFLGYADGSFGNQTIFFTGSNSHPTSVAVDDFNNDNQLDIAVANFGANNVGILIGHGNSTFTEYTRISLGSSRPWALVVKDLNKDNRMDIIIVNYGTNDLTILFGSSDGSFRNSMHYSTGYDSRPYSMAVADLNNDTHLDIAISNYGTSDVGISYGYGNGTFQNQIRYSTGRESNPSGIVIADLNRDDILDIALVNSGTDNIAIFLGYGNGNFTKPRIFSTGSNSHPSHITVGYFNEDNVLDIAVTHEGADSLGVLLGNKDGTFATQSAYSTGFGSHPNYVTIGDFNRNNRSDLIIVNTGIHNILTLGSYANNLSMELTTYSTGESSRPMFVTVGDFNGDHHLDVAMAIVDNINIFLGYGNGRFSNKMKYSTGKNSYPYSLVTADVNQDNQLDIVVANSGTGNVGIFLGYGNGMFAEQKTYSTGDNSGPTSIATGDLNGDYRLDIAVANYNVHRICILFGYGNGSFVDQETYLIGTFLYPNSIVVGDFNGDKRLDIAVANMRGDNIGIFLSYGDGTFRSEILYSTGKNSYPYSMIVADFNNDRQLDIAVAEYAIDKIALFLGYGNGSFAEQVQYSTGDGSRPTSINVGDFNNDSRLDIVVAISDYIGIFFASDHGIFTKQIKYSTNIESAPQSVIAGDFNNDSRLDVAVALYGPGNLGILIANFSANFDIQRNYSTGSRSHPSSIVIADLNNDTQLDIVVANVFDENFAIRFGYDNGIFAPETTYFTGSGSRPQYITVDYFDNDKSLDISIVDPSNNRIDVFLGDKNGSFNKQVTYSTDDLSRPCSLAVGNFNKDNWIDIVVANEGTDNVGIYLGYHYPSFQDPEMYSAGNVAYSSFIAVGDFNEDHHVDLAVTNTFDNNIGIFLGLGNGAFARQTTYPTGELSAPDSVTVANFNDDSHVDIAVTINGNIGIFLGYGNGTFMNMVTYSTGYNSRPQSIAAGDINGDHQLDITVTNSETDQIGIFLGYGDGTFARQIEYPTGMIFSPEAIYVADLNGDNRSDIVVTVSNYVGILLGYGNGTFASMIIYSNEDRSKPKSITIHDFNNDNRLDIAVINHDPDSVGVFLGNGNGTFKKQTRYSTGENSKPQSIAVGDLNGDQWLDIIVTNGFKKRVGLFFGYANETFTEQRSFSTGIQSFPRGVIVNDFNSDGLLDIVVADSFTSMIQVYLVDSIRLFDTKTTYSTGNESRPCSVVVADLNNDDRIDIIVANKGTNTIGIFLGYDNGTFANLITYSTGENSNPCAVVVHDFNNDDRLDIAVANSNTNNVDGSQPCSIAVSDFNNDHQLDIAVVNSGTNNVMILRGNGNGSFVFDSFIAMGYEARPNSIGVGYFNQDHWIDIAVANYGAGNIEILLKKC